MVDGGADGALAAWLSIARPVEAIGGAIERALGQRHGIGLSGCEALAVLANSRGWTPLIELCESIDLSQPRISRLIAKLEDDGMVERARDGNDGRAFQVRLTRKGRRVYSSAAETVATIVAGAAEDSNPIASLLKSKLGEGSRPS